MSQSALIDLSSVRVLCVDDDPVMRSIVRAALQRRGCRDVVQANGGIDALDLCAGRTFDLLICDVQMTPMTGIEFLRTLANSGLAEGWPVVMLSAETNPATIREAENIGVSAWVGKPVSIQVLMDRVSTVLRLHGHVTGGGHDGKMQDMAERCHAQLMAALIAAAETSKSLAYRPREIMSLAQTLRHHLDNIDEHARTLGYGLINLLAARARDLVQTLARFPAAAARGQAGAAGALSTTLTAMTRVAQNRMEGDGAEAGRKLLEKFDLITNPIRTGLN